MYISKKRKQFKNLKVEENNLNENYVSTKNGKYRNYLTTCKRANGIMLYQKNYDTLWLQLYKDVHLSKTRRTYAELIMMTAV